MKTFVAALGSALLAFTITFLAVPRRLPDQIPPSWFELPGTPVSVDNEPVDSWEQVNKMLNNRARMSLGTAEELLMKERMPEAPGSDIRIKYAPHNSPRSGDSPAVTTVVVRTWLPATILYSRASPQGLARYEIVRPDDGL